MSDMNNKDENPESVHSLHYNLRSIWKDFSKVKSEKNKLMEEAKRLKLYIDELQVQKADMQTKLDQYEIQVGKLNDEAAANKEQIIKLTSLLESKTEERGDQVCSEAQEEPRDSELDMKMLKKQLQQRDSELVRVKQKSMILSVQVKRLQKSQDLWNKTDEQILNLKQKNKILSTKVARLQKAKALWNEVDRENLILKQKNETLSVTDARLQKAEALWNEADEEIVNLKQENKILSTKVERLQKAEALWNETDKKIMILKQENKTLSAEVERLKKAEAERNEAAHREMVALIEQNKKLMGEHREVYKMQKLFRNAARKLEEQRKKLNEEKQLEEEKKGAWSLSQLS